MQMMENKDIEKLLPGWFEGTLSDKEKESVNDWKENNHQNLQVFIDSQKTWEAIIQLRNMQKYNAAKALDRVNRKIEKTRSLQIFRLFQKVAAVLILPLIIATFYFASKSFTTEPGEIAWNTIETPVGIRSEFKLPDGSKVFLNSNTSLSYPVAFKGETRNVTLNGEAYFEVFENKKQPFIVNPGKIQIEVTGTEFKVSNYTSEGLTEIVLASGSVNLFQQNNSGEKKILQKMVPGEKATYLEKEGRLYFENVEVDKYISWKDGILMFRDDSMQEVTQRLSRWFNVDIQLTGKELSDYVYTATFEDESLSQILDLLKLTAPIDYKIKRRVRNNDGTYNKMEIEIIQK